MSVKPEKLDIDPEFQSLIPPLSAEELAGLEASIKADGCRDSIIRWDVDGKRIVVDGHNRYDICHRNGILFKTSPHEFKGRDEAKIWILRNQLGRRNLDKPTRLELALQLEPLIKARAKARMLAGKAINGAIEGVLADPVQNSAQGKSRDELAHIAGVSHDLIDKYKAVKKSPVVELSRMTRANEISINAASEVAKEPEAVQRELVAKGPAAIKKFSGDKERERDLRKAIESNRSGVVVAHKKIGEIRRIVAELDKLASVHASRISPIEIKSKVDELKEIVSQVFPRR